MVDTASVLFWLRISKFRHCNRNSEIAHYWREAAWDNS